MPVLGRSTVKPYACSVLSFSTYYIWQAKQAEYVYPRSVSNLTALICFQKTMAYLSNIAIYQAVSPGLIKTYMASSLAHVLLMASIAAFDAT